MIHSMPIFDLGLIVRRTTAPPNMSHPDHDWPGQSIRCKVFTPINKGQIMVRSILGSFILVMVTITSAIAQDVYDEPDRDTLYKVTTLRAAPGELRGMIDDLQGLKADNYFAMAGRTNPWILRHSNGDHWDLMLVEPVGSVEAYFQSDRLSAEANAAQTNSARLQSLAARTDFEEDLFAWGPAPDVLGENFDTANIFHIEMFNARGGHLDALIEQREMENQYLAGAGWTTNWVFVREMGSDYDVFTIGGHDSWESYGADSALSDEELEDLAISAGFRARDDIGFYLRELLTTHNDTYARPVR